jgi:hypothetical protein
MDRLSFEEMTPHWTSYLIAIGRAERDSSFNRFRDEDVRLQIEAKYLTPYGWTDEELKTHLLSTLEGTAWVSDD